MQDTLSEFEAIIWVTGGLLEPNKSSWCLADYEWHQQKQKFKNPGIQKTLTEKPNEVITVPLCYLEAYESMEMLGMYLHADVDNHD